ncbi:hypothetical protein HMPREF9436_00414 [Faecalibacterium cf. prausnitzii KLE1255]|uniref:Uncharacterized protein n=1 Tax=Faecalibacterium cf. prausnitzii KLE1255 TaxID=748224 RepID=E2ZFI1_9FIRM|nr:hypothetical protein HMPREF9436_00414 [Faecalibacterium cf. prausnitzii KLE1255]
MGRKFCRKCVFRNNEDSRENVRFCEIEKITMKKSKNAVDRHLFMMYTDTRAPERRLKRTKSLSGGNRYEHYSREAR